MFSTKNVKHTTMQANDHLKAVKFESYQIVECKQYPVVMIL